MRRHWKIIFGMVMVLTVAFACEALAGVGCASKLTAKQVARAQLYFLTACAENTANFSQKARQAVWGLGGIPVSGEGILFRSKLLASKRSFREKREKKVESVIAAQKFSMAASSPVGFFSRPKVTSLMVCLFSTHIAVRK